MSCTEFYIYLAEVQDTMIDGDEHISFQERPEDKVPISGIKLQDCLGAWWRDDEWYLQVMPGRIPTCKPHNSLHLAPVIVSRELYLLVNLINKIIMFGTLQLV